MSEYAAELQRRVESHALAVRNWKEFPKPGEAGEGNRYITIWNGQAKKEGAAIPNFDGTREQLVDAMVRAALTYKTGNTLVWRRVPEFEERGASMRLVWLNA